MKTGFLIYLVSASIVYGQLVGNDRDSHGCIGSAGYSWCESLQKCIRPWETKCPPPAPSPSPPPPPPVPGGDVDEHGCKPSAGYTWCEPLKQCIQPWVTKCEAKGSPSPAPGSSPSPSPSLIPPSGAINNDASSNFVELAGSLLAAFLLL